MKKVKNLSADDAIKKLKEGNARFAKGKLKNQDISEKFRQELAQGQNPFAAILSCSDSRVPTEIIFNQGLGDIFVIRNAGNVLDEHVIGSIEYAVYVLGVKLIVVLGHDNCGAVTTAINPDKQTDAIESIKNSIFPAIFECKNEGKSSLSDVIKMNAKLSAQNIFKNNPDLKEFAKNEGVKAVSAHYNFENGEVEFCE